MKDHALHSALPPRKAGSLLPSCPRQLHASAQKSPGRPWPFFSPCLVTFHCSELWHAHVVVRENWLCWAGTTSCPQLVPPGSPLLQVSAQLPGPAADGLWDAPTRPAGQDAAGRAPRHLPCCCYFIHGLWICVVPNHLDIPTQLPTGVCKASNTSPFLGATASTLPVCGSTLLP